MADVDISQSRLSLDGSCKIVCCGNQFVWLRFLGDKKWMKNYQQSMLEVWRSQDPLGDGGQGSTKARKNSAVVPGNATGADATSVNSLGDIVIKKWSCTRTHQVLTRVFLTAEKHEAKTNNLLLTAKEEEDFRRKKKERSVLLEQICNQRLEDPGSNHLRDWLNRIWVLFVTGIDNDPAGERALSYDVRKSVHDAQFSNEAATILQASLLTFLIPSLKFETCYSLAVADFHAVPIQKHVENAGFESTQHRTTLPQRQFTHVFISFVGSFLDTLTEAEVVKAAAAFRPAVRDAQQRLFNSHVATSAIKKKDEDYSISKGDGIYIDHLDKLGRRKQVQKFA